MNGLHHLVAQGKVLYLVRLVASRRKPARLNHPDLGNLGHPGVARLEGKHVCAAHGQNALRDLSRRVEHPPARHGARHHSHGACRRCGLLRVVARLPGLVSADGL